MAGSFCQAQVRSLIGRIVRWFRRAEILRLRAQNDTFSVSVR